MIKGIANLISIVFHPLLMITLIFLTFLSMDPYVFGFSKPSQGAVLLIYVFFSTALIPGIIVFMLKSLGFIESVQMKTKKERIVPLVASSIFYLWVYINFKDNPDIPDLFSVFILASIVSLYLALLFNIFIKVSLHAIGIAGFFSFFVLLISDPSVNHFQIDSYFGFLDSRIILIFILFLCGLIGTSRLVSNSHTLKELIWGYVIGGIIPYLCYQIIL